MEARPRRRHYRLLPDWPLTRTATFIWRTAIITASGKISQSGIITTVAGKGTPGFSGDGGLATSAQLNNPFGIDIDVQGNLYIADTFNNRIRKVTRTGIISTVAGGTLSGFDGDGGPATSALLNAPFGVEIGPDGSIYIADTFNNRIRKVSPAGIITTIAGSSSFGYGGDGGPAISAEMNSPSSVKLDAWGNVLVADTYNNAVRQVTPEGVITTIAGMGAIGFTGDGGPATSARLNGPVGVVADVLGNLLIADTGNHRVRKVSGALGVATFFSQFAAGGGYATVITIGNNGADTASATLRLFDQLGNPFAVNATWSLPGSDPVSVIDSEFSFDLAPGSVGFVIAEALNPEDPVKVGSAEILSSGGSVYAVSMYKLVIDEVLTSAVGVLPSALMQYATIPVYDDYSQRQLTSYALSNPTSRNVTIKIGLVDQMGKLDKDRISIRLAPGQQVARYLHEDLNDSEFRYKGSIVIRAQGGGSFTAIGVFQNQDQFTAIPVIPGKAAHLPD